MADFFNCSPDEVIFGQNMTTITLGLARAIGRELKPGDEIVLTTSRSRCKLLSLESLEEKGVVIRTVDIRESDCTLDLDDLKSKLTDKTKLVAVGYASNAVGTINPVAEITKLAHAVGALIYIDAVHYAPHGPIDVKALDCDFLVCSPYKFFGPHMGTLYGKRSSPAQISSRTKSAPQRMSYPIAGKPARKFRNSSPGSPRLWTTSQNSAAVAIHRRSHDRRSALLAAYRVTRRLRNARCSRALD